jgi:hypothetical protein
MSTSPAHARLEGGPPAHAPDPVGCNGCADLVAAGAMPRDVELIRHSLGFDSWTTVAMRRWRRELEVIYVDVNGTVVDVREPVSA